MDPSDDSSSLYPTLSPAPPHCPRTDALLRPALLRGLALAALLGGAPSLALLVSPATESGWLAAGEGPSVLREASLLLALLGLLAAPVAIVERLAERKRPGLPREIVGTALAAIVGFLGADIIIFRALPRAPGLLSPGRWEALGLADPAVLLAGPSQGDVAWWSCVVPLALLLATLARLRGFSAARASGLTGVVAAGLTAGLIGGLEAHASAAGVVRFAALAFGTGAMAPLVYGAVDRLDRMWDGADRRLALRLAGVSSAS